MAHAENLYTEAAHRLYSAVYEDNIKLTKVSGEGGGGLSRMGVRGAGRIGSEMGKVLEQNVSKYKHVLLPQKMNLIKSTITIVKNVL